MTDIQGPLLCVVCNSNVRRYKGLKGGKRQYRLKCRACLGHGKGTKKRPYMIYRKASCEMCGFVPQHVCQLDVDHRDGDRTNNDPSNLQTLCANCHRLKTYYSRDWKS
jgi:hypothetical protein